MFSKRALVPAIGGVLLVECLTSLTYKIDRCYVLLLEANLPRRFSGDYS